MFYGKIHLNYSGVEMVNVLISKIDRDLFTETGVHGVSGLLALLAVEVVWLSKNAIAITQGK